MTKEEQAAQAAINYYRGLEGLRQAMAKQDWGDVEDFAIGLQTSSATLKQLGVDVTILHW